MVIWTRLPGGVQSFVKFMVYVLAAMGLNWLGKKCGVQEEMLAFIVAGLVKGAMTEFTTRQKK
jgi:hypothetical protein